ncbi:hypothetical protein CEV32_0011 [Brucella rhizosphaerae]|uniref:Uncharacterized protein n=1 Tax=Brucella rhizosphaerae TaxID=571254 RepID=A0A256FGR0_9HYPH|nr:hypothetical protein CEV32_0011 [Brucella rhizosphaerae]
MAHHLQKLPTSHICSGHFDRKSLKNTIICEFPNLFSANRLNFSHKQLSGKSKLRQPTAVSHTIAHIKTCATAGKAEAHAKNKACLS